MLQENMEALEVMPQTMEFKYAKIGQGASRESIEQEIARLEQLKTDFNNKDAALKIIINSIYGVAGYKNYIGYNKDVAASVTGQSRDILQFTNRCITHYFSKAFFKDTELHQKAGIKIKDILTEDQIGPVVNYMDTDSVFYLMENIWKACDFNGDITDFVLAIHKHRLDAYIVKRLTEYMKARGAHLTRLDGKFSFNLTLENVCESVLWAGKKKYIKNIVWKKGIRYKPLEQLAVTGLESNKASVPLFVRNKLKELVAKILKLSKEGGDIKAMLLSEVKIIKNEFMVADMDQICNLERITDYNKWVITDTTHLEFSSGAKPPSKGAAYYNFLLYKEPDDRRGMHEPIKSGMKVLYYYIKGSDMESFSYIPGDLPRFAPKVDYDTQFIKVFLGPLNNIVAKAFGYAIEDPSNYAIPGLDLW